MNLFTFYIQAHNGKQQFSCSAASYSKAFTEMLKWCQLNDFYILDFDHEET